MICLVSVRPGGGGLGCRDLLGECVRPGYKNLLGECQVKPGGGAGCACTQKSLATRPL